MGAADGALTIHEYVRSHPHLGGPLLLMARVAACGVAAPEGGGCALPRRRAASVALPGKPRSALHLAADGSAAYEVHDSARSSAARAYEDRRGTGRWAIEGEHWRAFLPVQGAYERLRPRGRRPRRGGGGCATKPPARCALTLAYERLPDGRASGGEWLVREREAAVADDGAAAPKRQDPLVSALLAVTRALQVPSSAVIGWRRREATSQG